MAQGRLDIGEEIRATSIRLIPSAAVVISLPCMRGAWWPTCLYRLPPNTFPGLSTVGSFSFFSSFLDVSDPFSLPCAVLPRVLVWTAKP